MNGAGEGNCKDYAGEPGKRRFHFLLINISEIKNWSIQLFLIPRINHNLLPVQIKAE